VKLNPAAAALNDAALIPIRELTRHCQVTEDSVLRACAKLGITPDVGPTKRRRVTFADACRIHSCLYPEAP
jgi:hypothetical protein